ncbi:helix-turn-helix transcriptional regulator [Rhodanobacter sp. B2A1Ga4]|uniref:ArsR/SmtB family transcription factor n=1 Tax=Rhodanobacter sp. B2A1Ga4 TaxID=2778647 RepID=UPI001B35EA1F|nr:metalloregulator ArsR/SmtB family transcription factor [Rhodanobacter sp. B2A1Ga4]MBQ4853916.1 helix-turn-helix transcriptional regulator [Rhodanobacter sp. B2A1Ga4]
MAASAQARLARRSPRAATVFAALGDCTRLALVVRLCDGSRQSITQLCDGQSLTRQAISKHLRVLEDARLVRSERAGRESLYALNPQPIGELRDYIDLVSSPWDNALARLKAFVEE